MYEDKDPCRFDFDKKYLAVVFFIYDAIYMGFLIAATTQYSSDCFVKQLGFGISMYVLIIALQSIFCTHTGLSNWYLGVGVLSGFVSFLHFIIAENIDCHKDFDIRDNKTNLYNFNYINAIIIATIAGLIIVCFILYMIDKYCKDEKQYEKNQMSNISDLNQLMSPMMR